MLFAISYCDTILYKKTKHTHEAKIMKFNVNPNNKSRKQIVTNDGAACLPGLQQPSSNRNHFPRRREPSTHFSATSRLRGQRSAGTQHVGRRSASCRRGPDQGGAVVNGGGGDRFQRNGGATAVKPVAREAGAVSAGATTRAGVWWWWW